MHIKEADANRTTDMSDELSHAIPFGLLELDAAGNVIRYSPSAEHDSSVPAWDIIGRNFFTEFAPAPEVREFQERFCAFMADGESVERSSLTYPSERGNVQIEMMLARLGEHAGVTRKRLALVRLTPERARVITSAE
jgi:photoactive yellow protein